MFTYPDKSDFQVIRFSIGTVKGINSWLFEKFVCGEDNLPNHGMDNCQLLMRNEIRWEYAEKSRKLLQNSGMILTNRETL